MDAVLLVAAITSAAAVIGWIALLVWAAIHDGRDQRRRDSLRHR